MCFFVLSTNIHAYTYEYIGTCKFVTYSKEFQECLDREYVYYDRELNSVYQQLFKQSNDRELQGVEDSWVKFKEADCRHMARKVNDGVFYPFIHKVCLINKTQARIADLKRTYYYSGWFHKQS